MTLWLTLAAITALAVIGLLLPVLRGAPAPASRRDYDLTVYRDQLAEIERDLARGVLSGDQAEAARTEVQRRMLAAADVGESESDATPAETADGPRRRSSVLATVIAIAVPLAALGLYAGLGAPGVPSLPLAERQGEIADGESLEGLATGLARRLAREEGEVADWLLLARTYAQLNRYAEAAEAAGQAVARGADDPETNGFHGEMLVAANNGTVVPAAREAFARVLEQDLANPRALYYAGLALAQDGQNERALELWTALARASQADAPWMPLLRQQMAEAADAAGKPLPEIAAAPPPAAAPGPSAADVEAAAAMSDEERAAFVRAMVERLAERLEEEPDDLEGWLRLSRAYHVLGEPEQALAAVERAESLVAALPSDAPQRDAVRDARRALGLGD